MAKATKLRQEEKAKNTETISDSEEAQAAVAQALTVLKEFYAKAGEATALIQAEPEIFDSPYKGPGLGKRRRHDRSRNCPAGGGGPGEARLEAEGGEGGG